jgi:SpoVK/Ycf46/Vps4 family AAA+-type ATPase
LPSYVVVCAATNHPELLDRAVWRRFQMRVNLPAPTRSERAKFLTILAGRYGVDLNLAPRTIIDKLGAASYAELQEFVLELRRRQILALPGFAGVGVTRDLIARWRARSGSGVDQVEPDGTKQ